MRISSLRYNRPQEERIEVKADPVVLIIQEPWKSVTVLLSDEEATELAEKLNKAVTQSSEGK